MANILIIDSDAGFVSELARGLIAGGHEVRFADSVSQAASGGYLEADIVFSSAENADGDLARHVECLRSAPSSPEVIIAADGESPELLERAIFGGAIECLRKSDLLAANAAIVERALNRRQETTPSSLDLSFPEIIGRSPTMRASLSLLSRAAASDVDVLITGETGTGKELFACAVHENSRRCGKPFVVVDCAALPENLVESTLFGHEKGAFTGAASGRSGLIKEAHGGTLFLDEVGELPLVLQKAFLRVLHERRYRAIGSTRETASDFRLIAATNRDLESMVRRGVFREDLLFRLRSLAIELPPLRGRREDIRDLARHCIERFSERDELGPKKLSPECLEALYEYSWPGNVRELMQVLEGAIALAPKAEVLYPHHLPTYIRVNFARALAQQSLLESETSREAKAVSSFPTLKEAREQAVEAAEREYLEKLLSHTGEDIGAACRLSGLSRSRFYALLKKHGLSRLVERVMLAEDRLCTQ